MKRLLIIIVLWSLSACSPKEQAEADNARLLAQPTATAAAIRNQEAQIRVNVVVPAQAQAEAKSIVARTDQQIAEDAHQQALRHQGEIAALTMSNTLQLAQQLLACPSVTPNDAGCQALIVPRLAAMGFVCETITAGPASGMVTNLWAKRPGTLVSTAQAASNSVATLTPAKTLVFAGHTDVVPTGPLNEWHSAPFVPTHRDGKLFGRGASDMKTSLAAFRVAIEDFLRNTPEPNLNIALLLTSDEEGPANDGTVVVCKALQERGEKLDYCIVGEPTSVERTGDMIKNGRRGSMSGKLTVKLPGKKAWKSYGPGKTFAVPANEKFQLKVSEESAYLCLYK